MDLNPRIEEFREWIPIRILDNDGTALVDWCHIGDARLTHPFFEDSINVQFRRPFSLLFRRETPIEVLRDLYQRSPGVKPRGFIFHMSRCGSTLLTQMFSRLPKNIVISEAPPIDSVLRATRAGLCSEEERADWLRWLLNAYGQRRRGGEEHLLVKFDSWATADLGFVARAFPDVPWVFVYREPVEVIVSHMRQRGVQMIPGFINGLIPFGAEESSAIAAEEYCARVLASVCSDALHFANAGSGRFVNYSELPDAFDAIAEHFGLQFSPGEMQQIRTAVQFNAKTPQMFFEPDSVHKRNAADDAVLQAAARWVEPLYLKLENVRLAQGATL